MSREQLQTGNPLVISERHFTAGLTVRIADGASCAGPVGEDEARDVFDPVNTGSIGPDGDNSVAFSREARILSDDFLRGHPRELRVVRLWIPKANAICVCIW